MPDIFISYSSKDIQYVRIIASYLESNGWDVWWDQNLNIGDDFQLKLNDRLIDSKAVVVLWTKNSVKSQWVRAEAVAAQRDMKLFPVRAGNLPYEEIPPPFNLIHAIDLNELEALTSALKQHVEARKGRRVGKLIRFEVLTLIGVFGSAFTIFSNIDGLIRLSKWARVIVESWHEWTRQLWHALGQIFKFDIPASVADFLTFVLFIISTTVSARLVAGELRSPKLSSFFRNVLYVFLIAIALSAFTGFLVWLYFIPLAGYIYGADSSARTNFAILLGITTGVLLLIFSAVILARRSQTIPASVTAFASLFGVLFSLAFAYLLVGGALEAIRTGEGIEDVYGGDGTMTVRLPIFIVDQWINVVLTAGFLSGFSVVIPMFLTHHGYLLKRYVYISVAIVCLVVLNEIAKFDALN